MKASFFFDDDYDWESSSDKILPFVDLLKGHGCYIASDGHIRDKKGGLMSKLCRSGYWLTMAQYDKKLYYFYEHRVIWTWYNGLIPTDTWVSHKDYNTSNNHIENLELLGKEECAIYLNHLKSERKHDGYNTLFNERQVLALQKIGKICGWNDKQLDSIINVPSISFDNTTVRVLDTQYQPNIQESIILKTFPTIVNFTRNKAIGIDEELKNYALGLSGEVGEFNDLIKKMFYHGKDVQPVDIALELGDILYYLVAICNVLGFDFSEIALNNNAKLMARYPEGFSIQKSNERIEEEANINN